MKSWVPVSAVCIIILLGTYKTSIISHYSHNLKYIINLTCSVQKYLIIRILTFDITQGFSGVATYYKRNCQVLKNYLKHSCIPTQFWQVSKIKYKCFQKM